LILFGFRANPPGGLNAILIQTNSSGFDFFVLVFGFSNFSCSPQLMLIGAGQGSNSIEGDTSAGVGNPLAIRLDFKVTNTSATERTQTITVSVPFPAGGYLPSDLENLIVSGRRTAWLPMQLWADGRVKIAQAQFTDELKPGETKSYSVASGENSMSGVFTRNRWVAEAGANLEIGAEVRDTFNVPYRAFVTGPGEVLQSTPLVQTKRWRTYHTSVQPGAGIGRDYLTSTYYVTEYRDMPFMVVDWIIGNDYLGADQIPTGNTDPNLRALGPVDVRSAKFLFRGANEALPYRPLTENIGDRHPTDGYQSFQVMQNDWIADGQTRRYRFVLRFEPNNPPVSEQVRWQRSANAMVEHPLFGLATANAWLQTKAAGLLGGPILGPTDAPARARQELESWAANTTWYGTWGSRGDVLPTATTGTPRNHPLSPELAHAIQGEFPPLLLKLEQMAWTQAMRPFHLWGLEVGDRQRIMLYEGLPYLAVQGETLGRRRLRDQDPYPQYRTLGSASPTHGYNAYDSEHWSTDLLFDYWTISGDAWAKEELRQLGQNLKSVLRLEYYATSNVMPVRAEGWGMHSFAQIYQATRDQSLKAYAMRRVTEVIEAQRKKTHPSRALMFMPSYGGTGYPLDHEFIYSYQYGSLLYGYLGAYKAFGEPLLLTIAEDSVETIQYSWVTNITQAPYGFIPQGLRYMIPISHNGTPIPANYWDNLPGGIRFGDSPLGGSHSMLIGGLHHLADFTNNNSIRTRALYYGGMLRGDVSNSDRWNKWYYCLPPEYAP
jgi:hypothetical protein